MITIKGLSGIQSAVVLDSKEDTVLVPVTETLLPVSVLSEVLLETDATQVNFSLAGNVVHLEVIGSLNRKQVENIMNVVYGGYV